MARLAGLFFALLLLLGSLTAQEMHEHNPPEELGKVSFPTSCKPAVQPQFERAVALLHSFAYSSAESAFREVAEKDPQCAMAHWGIAMSYYHQLWDPPISPANMERGNQEIERAKQIGGGSDRERGFIDALAIIYTPGETESTQQRYQRYMQAMAKVATANGSDTESQVFYALSLLAVASPGDKTHTNQKRAVAILEPLYAKYPQHPGMAHYLIHASDNSEMASHGLVAAQAYAKVAPSAPHALHMPSHIFTRLGMWNDSIASNRAAREAARQQGDIGEELHAMDYLVYAYLQSGRETEAAQVVSEVKAMPELARGDFKVGYAATAMPIRYVVERKQWAEAANILPPVGAPPHVAAIAVWARGLGLSRSGHAAEARVQAATLLQLEEQLHKLGREYWATQVAVQRIEVLGWSARAEGKSEEAVAYLRKAADMEDAVEKLPVTPGPIVPAREQLGDLLLELNQPQTALQEFQISLVNAPGRQGALKGERAAQLSLAAQRSQAATDRPAGSQPIAEPISQQ